MLVIFFVLTWNLFIKSGIKVFHTKRWSLTSCVRKVLVMLRILSGKNVAWWWVLLLFRDALGRFAPSAPGYRDCLFLLVAHSARYWSSHHTWQTRFFYVPSVKHWFTGAFFLEKTSTCPLLVISVEVREWNSQSLGRQSSVLPLSQMGVK